MGKPLDNRVVQYAFSSQHILIPNMRYPQPDGSMKYRHFLQITYDLLDADKNIIGNRDMPHYTDAFDAMETVDQVRDRLAAAIDGWSAADKLELSGYQ